MFSTLISLERWPSKKYADVERAPLGEIGCSNEYEGQDQQSAFLQCSTQYKYNNRLSIVANISVVI
jgi:hypothetical protein